MEGDDSMPVLVDRNRKIRLRMHSEVRYPG